MRGDALRFEVRVDIALGGAIPHRLRLLCDLRLLGFLRQPRLLFGPLDLFALCLSQLRYVTAFCLPRTQRTDVIALCVAVGTVLIKPDLIPCVLLSAPVYRGVSAPYLTSNN